LSTPRRWRDLRAYTDARVGLGRSGNALPTAAHLDFQEAHAVARDAVFSALDVPALLAALPGSVAVQSQAPDRRTYLLRPDLGRRLADAAPLAPHAGDWDIAVVIADGLCATGVQCHAPEVLARVRPRLRDAGLRVAPPVIATQARVALGDPIGQALGARAVAVLIGERPGLSALDSMGIYLTWAPRPGRTDAQRNCISNVRPRGLSYDDAAAKLLWLIQAMRALGATGVALKDEMPEAARLADPAAAPAIR
jgi:ethanolamine ammonia-lyase small subunit